MGLSIDTNLYTNDPVKHQFVRRSKNGPRSGIRMHIREEGISGQYHIACAPLDLAIILNKMNPFPGWEYSRVDTTWTMVLVRSEVLAGDAVPI